MSKEMVLLVGFVPPCGTKSGGHLTLSNPPKTITAPKTIPRDSNANEIPFVAIRYWPIGGTITEHRP